MIVPADAAHHLPIAELSRAAFGTGAEGNLISRLRENGMVLIELVALDQAEIIGHILFSRLGVEVDGRSLISASLAPMAVREDRRLQGIGAQLILRGLASLRAQGCEAVIVLGHPSYYPRFGFSAALASKLAAPFKGDAFMALELVPGALAGHGGSVSYPSVFGLV
jgi:putative acetyltransferase